MLKQKKIHNRAKKWMYIYFKFKLFIIYSKIWSKITDNNNKIILPFVNYYFSFLSQALFTQIDDNFFFFFWQKVVTLKKQIETWNSKGLSGLRCIFFLTYNIVLMVNIGSTTCKAIKFGVPLWHKPSKLII